MLDAELLAVLVCPKCRGELRYEPEASALFCDACRLRYEVRDDVPVLLIDEAAPY